jgi:hypothetical protein
VVVVFGTVVAMLPSASPSRAAVTAPAKPEALAGHPAASLVGSGD